MTIKIILILLGISFLVYGFYKRKSTVKNHLLVINVLGVILISLSLVWMITDPSPSNVTTSNGQANNNADDASMLNNEIEKKELNLEKYNDKFNLSELLNEVEALIGLEGPFYYDELLVQIKEKKLSSIEFKLSRNKSGATYIRAISNNNTLIISTLENDLIGFTGTDKEEFISDYNYGLTCFKLSTANSYNILVDNNTKLVESDVEKGCEILSKDYSDKRVAKNRDIEESDTKTSKYKHLYIDYIEEGNSNQEFLRYYIIK